MPLWGPVLALLYLSRSSSKNKSNSGGRTLSAGHNNNPLIFDDDDGQYGKDFSHTDLTSHLLAHEVLAAAVSRSSNQTARSADSTTRERGSAGSSDAHNPSGGMSKHRSRRGDDGGGGGNSGGALPSNREGGTASADLASLRRPVGANDESSTTTVGTFSDAIGAEVNLFSPDSSFNYRDTVISQQTGASAMPSEIYYRDIKGGNMNNAYSIDYSYSHRLEPEEITTPLSSTKR